MYIIFLPCVIFAQYAKISGQIIDNINKETLAGVNILIDSTQGLTTDKKGSFFITVKPGTHILCFSFIGYKNQKKNIHVLKDDTVFLKIMMQPSSITLNTAVVTAGLYIQKLSDVSVSLTVIQPKFIENRNTKNMESVFNHMPGIDVLDGQASIRGGGGYSYGAGSRVLLVLDELPLLTADVGEVKWNFLPIENIAQVEIVKGASSSLYGSSALNGVINLRTIWPGLTPKTTITLYSGFYDTPKRKELSWWWNNNPIFGGFRFSHSQRFKNLDVVTGADLYNNAGYREKNYEQHARINAKLRYRPQNISGLSFGLSTNIQWQKSSGFFLWQNADSGAYLQQPAGIAPTIGFCLLLDPRITYFDKHNNKHSLLTRFYKVNNTFKNNHDKDNGSEMYYSEYRFYKKIHKKLDVNLGVTALYGVTKAALYGNHFNNNFAIFAQFDYKIIAPLTLSGGYRLEYYSLDNSDEKVSNVFRAGLNFKAANYTFIRASFGQGYRYPSIAEKYIKTSVGVLNIFPNPELKSETGWSSEVGLKQGYKLGGITGFVDAAIFLTEYHNMIEFTFGIYKPDSVQYPSINDLGFKSLNVGEAQISGIDITLSGTGKTGSVPVTFFAGYTFMNPIDLSSDTLKNNILKYRYRHSIKGDVSMSYKKVSFGTSMIYRSFMERIDAAFEDKILGVEIMPGLKQYRENNDKGALIFDIHAAYQLSHHVKISFVAKNIFNKEYMGRPGDLRPPRNYAVQILAGF